MKKGFSLIEVIVAMALLGIVAAGITALITNSMKQQRGIQAKDHQRELTSEIRSFLANKTACTNTFIGTDPDPGGTVPALKDALGIDKYMLANDRTGQLKFEEFKITGWIPDAGFTNQGNVDFKIKFLRIGDTASAVELRPDVITLKSKLDVSGNILECFAIGTQADSLWQKNLVNTNDIYYTAGAVGIGISAPGAKFEVQDSSTAATFGKTVIVTGIYEPTASNSNDYWLFNAQATYNGTTNSDRFISGHFDSHLNSSGSLQRTEGIVGKSSTEPGSSGNINLAYGVYGLIDHYGTGTLNEAAAIFAAVKRWPGSNQITTGFGLRIGEVDALNAFGVYQTELLAKNYFNGNVGIGIINSTTKLQVEGIISPATTNTYSLGTSSLAFSTVYTTAGTVTASDARMKKDVFNVDLGLDFINKLRPVTYRWKNSSDRKIHYGLLAQEAQNTLQSSLNKTAANSAAIIDYDLESDKFGIRYSELIAPLIKAIQQLYALVRGFQQTLDLADINFKAEIKKRDLQIEKLKEENNAIKAHLCLKNTKASFCQ